MDALDLRRSPPRTPRAELAGITFLPRSIDKVRATLPGGKLGVYKIEGFTQTMLDKLGISVADFTEAVRTAKSDDDVAAFVTANAQPGSIEAWHDYVGQRKPKDGNREEALVAYPFLADRPDLVFSLDVLEEDDRHMFARYHT